MNITTEERFFRHVHKTATCWLWTGHRNTKGYGKFRVDGRTVSAHRFSWEMVNGPIPPGLTQDHLCRTPACVRPDHLEPVTNLENTLRGENFIAVHAAKTHCVNGHPFDEQNTLIHISKGRPRRVCRACSKIRVQRWEQRHGVQR